jgi:hypothetical protein
MASGEMPEHYYTYDGRLASFQSSQQVVRRGSTAKGRAKKALSWPPELDPEIVRDETNKLTVTPRHIANLP